MGNDSTKRRPPRPVKRIRSPSPSKKVGAAAAALAPAAQNTPLKDRWPSLLRRVRRGDEAAATRVVQLLDGHIRKIVLARLPRRHEPEDLMQEIFMKIFNRLHQYRGKAKFEHWAARVARATCFDHLRRQQARPELLWSELDGAERLAVDNSPKREPETASPRALREILDRLLGQLPPDDAWLVRKIELEQCSVLEVCAVMDWSHGAARVRLLRARRKLKSIFARLEKNASLKSG